MREREVARREDLDVAVELDAALAVVGRQAKVDHRLVGGKLGVESVNDAPAETLVRTDLAGDRLDRFARDDVEANHLRGGGSGGGDDTARAQREGSGGHDWLLTDVRAGS